jgi:hypothetical protein
MSALTGKLTGNGDGGRWNVPAPAVPDGGHLSHFHPHGGKLLLIPVP